MYIPLLSVARGHPPPHCENTQVLREANTEDDDDERPGAGLITHWSRTKMAEKVKKIYTCCQYDFDISLHFSSFMMTTGAKYLDNITVYGFITQLVICFMV